jgi:acetoin utilization protein AcuB
MRLSEIMSSPVTAVSPGESAERAWTRMRIENIHHLIVMERGDVVGVVSERELADESDRTDATVGDRMLGRVVTATSHTTVKDAANLMRGHAAGCLPVVDDGKLVGVITISDLLELLGRGALRPAPFGERPVLKDRGPRRKHPPRV